MSKFALAISLLALVITTLFGTRAGFSWYSRIFLGFGACHRCGISWNMIEEHTTWYTAGVGCFPLCEKCWSKLTPQTRLPYYRELLALDGWRDDKDLDKKWVLIKAAVEAGK